MGAYINNYTVTRGISPTNTKQVYRDYKTSMNNPSKSVGKAFDPNGKTVQQGVDPNTLIPGKDLSTLDDKRLKDAIKYGSDKSIIVDRNGKVLDGNHRLKYALDNNKSVDITIGY